MGVKYGKVWGSTEPLIVNDRVEIHRINIKAEAQCSEHRHASRYNAFYVLRGWVTITVWKGDTGLKDTIMLDEGEMTTVAPGDWHQFFAHEDSALLEIYYPADFTPQDIERRTKGQQGF